jgi:hypothetical protein
MKKIKVGRKWLTIGSTREVKKEVEPKKKSK